MPSFSHNHLNTQKALKESEELYRQILTSISDTVFITNDNDEFTYICPNVDHNFGYSAVELMKFETSRRVFGKKLFSNVELLEQRELNNIECEIIDKYGNRKIMLVSVKKVSINKGTNLFTCRNITSLKKTEKGLKEKKANLFSLIENIDECVWSINSKGKLMQANSVFTKILTKRLNYLYKVGDDLFNDAVFTKAEIKRWKMLYKRVLNGEKFIVEESSSLFSKNKIYEFRFNPIKADDDAILGATIYGMDITSKKKDEAKLKKQQMELSEANTALKVLLKNSYESKNEIEENIKLKISSSILPYIKKLNGLNINKQAKVAVDAIKKNLNSLAVPYSQNLKLLQLQLTPSEIQISNLIRSGNSSKEIAHLLHLSVQTIEFHRKNIRQKLGIRKQKINLQNYLVSFH